MVTVHALTQDSRNTLIKPAKNRKKPVFLIYSSRYLDGFEGYSVTVFAFLMADKFTVGNI